MSCEKLLLYSQLFDGKSILVAQLFIWVLKREEAQHLNGIDPKGLLTSTIDATLALYL